MRITFDACIPSNASVRALAANAASFMRVQEPLVFIHYISSEFSQFFPMYLIICNHARLNCTGWETSIECIWCLIGFLTKQCTFFYFTSQRQRYHHVHFTNLWCLIIEIRNNMRWIFFILHIHANKYSHSAPPVGHNISFPNLICCYSVISSHQHLL